MNKNYIWGIILIIVGVVFGLNSLELTNINIFFKGWWTLLIIIPSLQGLIEGKEMKSSLICLIVGLLLLLNSRNIISFDLIWKLFFPIVIVSVGISLLLNNNDIKNVNKEINDLSKKKLKNSITATFSEQKIDYNNEKFTGAEINSIFGSVELDLNKALITKDILINVTNIFGGTDIIVPKNVKVISKHNSIFGGVENKLSTKDMPEKPIIYINSVNIFGGLKIK